MLKIHEYMSAVKQEDYFYRWGKTSREEFDYRLQKIAKKHDRKIFRFNRKVVIKNA